MVVEEVKVWQKTEEPKAGHCLSIDLLAVVHERIHEAPLQIQEQKI